MQRKGHTSAELGMKKEYDKHLLIMLKVGIFTLCVTYEVENKEPKALSVLGRYKPQK